MSSEFTRDLMPLASGKDQENNLQEDIKMGKRKREDTDVEGSPRKKIQGRGNMTRSTDPCNNVQEEVSVRKRRAGDDGKMPGKRTRCSDLTVPAEHSDVSVEERRTQSGKRKASVDARTSNKKKRCSINNTTDPNAESVEVSQVVLEKRKATDDGEEPEKKIRCSDSSSTESSIKVIDLVSSSDVSHNFGSVSAEEEKIYEMSSSGNTSRADFQSKYVELVQIGAGGFGSVYGGFSTADFLPVAIKHIPSNDVRCDRVACNGKVFNIILEVAFMLKTAGLPGSVGHSAAVSLLDWYILDQELILVMERPANSKDLQKYLQDKKGSLDECEAKMILRQLVDAAIDMHSKGVFHRDIKLQNVLVQLDSGVPRVRIIDFGCGSFSTEKSYTSFCGTRVYAPPEWYDYGTYWARHTTVWQLGALFYLLLSGHGGFSTNGFINNYIEINRALSTDCKTLLYMCLTRDPAERVTLEQLQLHSALRKPSPPPT